MHTTSVAELIHQMPTLLDSAKAAGKTAAAHFYITGDGGGDYTVRLLDGRCSVVAGIDGSANCTVTMSTETYLSVGSGQTAPESAYMLGRIKTSSVSELIRFMGFFKRH